MSNLKSYYFVAAAVTYSGIPRNFYDACTYEYTTPNAVQQRERVMWLRGKEKKEQ
jgi:hypothetical protein